MGLNADSSQTQRGASFFLFFSRCVWACMCVSGLSVWHISNRNMWSLWRADWQVGNDQRGCFLCFMLGSEREIHLYCRCLFFFMGSTCKQRSHIHTHTHMYEHKLWVILTLLTITATNTYLRFSLILQIVPHSLPSNKSLNSCRPHADSQSSELSSELYRTSIKY